MANIFGQRSLGSAGLQGLGNAIGGQFGVSLGSNDSATAIFQATSTTSTTDGTGLWDQWAGGAAGTDTISNQWPVWVNNVQPQFTWETWVQGMPDVRGATHQDLQRAEAAIAERRHQLAEIEERRVIEAEKTALITKKASKILIDNLTEEQARSWRNRKVIPITAQSGKHYEVEGSSVYELDNRGKRVIHHCIQPQLQIPVEDAILARIMWLRWCEDDFKKIAIPTRYAA